VQHFLAGSGHVDTDQVLLVAQAIQSFGQPVETRALQEELHLSQTRLTHILTRLEELEVIEMLPTAEVAPKQGAFDLEDVAEDVVQNHESHRKYEHSRVEMMRGYAEVKDCRREYLLNYFGEEFDEPCGYCDNCDRGIVLEEDEADMPFPLNSKVMHKTWGEGLVVRYEGDKMVVLFDTVGYKTLSVNIVQERDLLTGK
jgi:ATP-dependent DNA helicase RecQ